MPEKEELLGGFTATEQTAIKDKIAAGLTREQAETVVLSQREWDANPANPANAKPARKNSKAD